MWNDFGLIYLSMKSLTDNKGRIFIACLWHSPGRTLLHIFIPLLNLSCISAPAFISPAPETDIIPEEEPEQYSIDISCSEPLETLDLYLYNISGIQELLAEYHYRSPECTIEISSSSPAVIMAVGNLGGELNTEAIRLLSSMEKLIIPFSAERSHFPTVSASTTLERNTLLLLRPLRSEVVLRSICHDFPYYQLMEQPRVRLSNIPAQAELFRWAGFHEADVTQGDWVGLPCDVGFFTQYPDIHLFCFPSDDKNAGGGTRWPVLELEYLRGGELMHYTKEIGPIGRADTVYLDLELTSSSRIARSCSEGAYVSLREEESCNLLQKRASAPCHN